MNDVVTLPNTKGINTNADGTQVFNPTVLVLRRDMARFIVRARGESPVAQSGCNPNSLQFTDVPCTDLDWGWIERFGLDGITQGCGTALFCPGNNVSRGEMAKFIGKGLNHTGSTTLCDATHPPHFDDVPCDHLFWKWIQEFYEDGITDGCGGSPPDYCPDNNIQRLEMAKFIGKGWQY
jgi:hypothetical protein